jgi:hypothetical protein
VIYESIHRRRDARKGNPLVMFTIRGWFLLIKNTRRWKRIY